LLTQVEPAAGLPLLIIGFVLAFLGGGPIGALGTTIVVSAAPTSKAGSAASISETGTHLGIALGIAVLGSIAGASYRHALVLPAALPADAGRAARDSITAATAAADQLPADVAGPLRDAATHAFTVGLNTTATIGMVLFAGLAVLAAAALRRISLTGA
jgi:DHA2 family multidrug resistance protein-like MFS transporter